MDINVRNKLQQILPYVGMGILIWVLDALIDAAVFYEGSFLDLLVYEVGAFELYFRAVVIGTTAVALLVYQRTAEKRRHAERARAHSEEVFRRITSAAHDAIVVFDTTRHITFWNQAAQRIFGYSSEEALRKDGSVLLVPHPADNLLATLFPSGQRVQPDASVGQVVELTGRRKDASAFPAEISVASLPLETGGNVVWILRDVSARKQAEESLRRAYDEMEATVRMRTAELANANAALRTEIAGHERAEDQLRQAALTLQQQAARLAEADRRKDEFLAVLAHELRNPLAPISNAVEVLKRQAGPVPPVVQWAEALIARQINHLTRLVDDLLDVARITRGRIKLKKECVALADIVNRAVENARPAIDLHRHALSVSVPAESLALEADPVRLMQVVGNLLDNAAKYTPEGGCIVLSVTREDGEAVIRVQDNGAGIAPERLPRIFEPFGRADAASSRNEGGLGLGLSVARGLVDLHGGSIRAESAGVGQGSTFTVRLPLPKIALPVDRERSTVSQAAVTARRLLVVEDHPDVAESFERLLQALDHEVRIVPTGLAALEAAREFRPEMVFVDIGLPDIDGYEVARRLRAEHGAALRLVAVTGYGQESDRRRSREAGFEQHLLKPVNIEALEAVLAA